MTALHATPKFNIPAHLSGRAAFRVRDIVEAFGFSRGKVFQLIKDGRLEAFKLDGVLLINRASVERLLESAVPVTGRK